MNKHKNSQPRNSIRPLNKKTTQIGYSLHHLHALNNKLENEKQQRKKALQKMKQDKAISNKIETIVGEGFEKVQNNGVHFASKIQEQRRKHKALTALVSHYQSLIYKQKLQTHNQMMKTKQIKQISKTSQTTTIYKNSKTKTEHQTNPFQIQNFELGFSSPSKSNQLLQEQIHHLKQLESQFQQYILRNNTSQYELSKKLDEVRTMRSERTVFNKVFDQFQKQLFEHQFQYKKLVIERTILENQFQQKVLSYQNIAAKAQKQYEKMLKNKKKVQTDRIFNTISIERDVHLNGNFQQKKQNNTQLDLKQATQQHIDKKQILNDISTIRYTLAEEGDKNFSNNQDICLRFYTSNDKKVNFTSYGENARSYTQNTQITKRNKCNTFETKRQLNKQKNLQYQKKVKQIYEQLKIMNSQQIPNILQNFQANIANLYDLQEELSQELYEKEKYYKNYEEFRNKNRNRIIINNNLSGMIVLDNIDQEKEMDSYLHKKQSLKSRIEYIRKNNRIIENQLINFTSEQISKVNHLLMDKSSNSQYTLCLLQKQLGIQFAVQKICQLQQQLNKILLISPQPILTSFKKLNDGSNNHYISYNSQKQTQNQEIHRKQTEKDIFNPKRDTHKSAKLNQSVSMGTMNFIPNVNASFYKDKDRKDKSNKNRYHDNKQLTQQPSQKTNKLQQILQANRTTHNTISIYTEQQLMQISRRIINKEREKCQIFANSNFQQAVIINKSNFFVNNFKESKENKQNENYSNFQ